jgi:hypothetical protein
MFFNDRTAGVSNIYSNFCQIYAEESWPIKCDAGYPCYSSELRERQKFISFAWATTLSNSCISRIENLFFSIIFLP